MVSGKGQSSTVVLMVLDLPYSDGLSKQEMCNVIT